MNSSLVLRPNTLTHSTDEGAGKIWRIITAYLADSSVSPDVAAAELAGHLTIASLSLPDDHSLNVFRWPELIYAITFDVAAQIPTDHDWQFRLVLLLEALRTQPAPPIEVGNAITKMSCWEQRDFQWSELPLFSRTVGHLWEVKQPWHQHTSQAALEISDQLGTEAWANINSFLALIAIRGSTDDPSVEGLLGLGARLLRQTLELPLPNKRLEQNLPAAITWIFNAGPIMYSNPGIEVEKPRPRPGNRDGDVLGTRYIEFGKMAGK